MRKKAEPLSELDSEDLARWAERDTPVEPSQTAKSDMERVAQKHVKELAEAYSKLIFG